MLNPKRDVISAPRNRSASQQETELNQASNLRWILALVPEDGA
jgi:hypothetical protein